MKADSIKKMPLSMLEGSPFKNFLLPGLILTIFNGFGNVLSGILSFRKQKLAGFAGIFDFSSILQNIKK